MMWPMEEQNIGSLFLTKPELDELFYLTENTQSHVDFCVCKRCGRVMELNFLEAERVRICRHITAKMSERVAKMRMRHVTAKTSD